MRRFSGIKLGCDRIRDETTILNFRHLLERHGLAQAIFADVNAHLADKGITLRSGTLVDVSRRTPSARASLRKIIDAVSGVVHSLGPSTAIRGVEVRVYSITKSIADAFRNPKLVDRSVAIEAMKSALSDRKATPGQLAEAAQENRVWNQMRPYLEALTSNG